MEEPKVSWDQLSLILFKGNIEKEERITFSIARITHYISLLIVSAGFLTIIIFAFMGVNTDYQKLDIAMFFGMCFLGFGIIVINGFIIKFMNLIMPFGHTSLAVLMYRSLQKFMYLLPAIIGLVLGVTGETWYVVLPLFIGSGIALIWSFPTKHRWYKWHRPSPGSIYPE